MFVQGLTEVCSLSKYYFNQNNKSWSFSSRLGNKKMKKICDIISDNDYIIIHIITRLKYNINRTTSVVKEWEERAGREATAQSTSVDCTTVRLSARETYNQQTKNFVLNLNIKKMESPGKRQKLDNSSQYLVTSFQPILHPYVPPQTLILGNNNISET